MAGSVRAAFGLLSLSGASASSLPLLGARKASAVGQIATASWAGPSFHVGRRSLATVQVGTPVPVALNTAESSSLSPLPSTDSSNRAPYQRSRSFRDKLNELVQQRWFVDENGYVDDETALKASMQAWNALPSDTAREAEYACAQAFRQAIMRCFEVRHQNSLGEARRAWKTMSDEERKETLEDLRFECLRRVGWKRNLDDETAKETFKALGAKDRAKEEAAAWRFRDRSKVYVDDQALVLGRPGVQWFSSPVHVGKLSFLPNTIVRIVRNHRKLVRDSATGELVQEPEDPWKATFRVPLDMHKHDFRNYLSSIYGVETTWINSMVYRSPLSRDTQRRVVTGKGRTFKKVEVGLVEPFWFPPPQDELVNETFMHKDMSAERRNRLLKYTKAWRWRTKKEDGTMTSGRATILRNLAKRRAMRLMEIKERIPSESVVEQTV